MLGIAKVVGSSMLPTFSDGDFVVTARPLFRSYHKGDIVAVRHPNLGGIIKRICTCVDDGNYLLVGDNPQLSTSTSDIGLVTADQITGRVIFTIRK